MSRNLRKYRIGKTHMQNCGQEAKIVGYRNSQDMDVQFPDGTIVEHKKYDRFKKGSINHPNINRYKHANERIGKKQIQNCGLEAEIIEYRSASDMDVRFPDGTTVEHRAYSDFKKGSIDHPNKAANRIGKTHIQKCGLETEIIEYRKSDDIDIRFPDGTIVEHRTYGQFKRGSINHPNINRYETRINERMSKKRTQKCGLEAEIIKYRKSTDIDIRFSDGTIVEHTRYDSFNRRKIKHPTINTHFNIERIYPRSKSKIYHTEIHGIAYVIDNTYYYFCHCPKCQTHEIWTFNEIKSHKCNQKLAKERDKFIQTLKTQPNVSVA